MTKFACTVSVLALVVTAACGGSDDDTASTRTITAAEGGVLDVGDATVTIPIGAVSEDVEVTLTAGTIDDYPALEGADNRVLVFEPPMSLDAMATLLIEPEQELPVDGFATIRIFTDGVWISPDVSSVMIDGKISTGIPFLAPVAVVVPQPE